MGACLCRSDYTRWVPIAIPDSVQEWEAAGGAVAALCLEQLARIARRGPRSSSHKGFQAHHAFVGPSDDEEAGKPTKAQLEVEAERVRAWHETHNAKRKARTADEAAAGESETAYGPPPPPEGALAGPPVGRRVANETEASLRGLAAAVRRYGPSAHTMASPAARFWAEQASRTREHAQDGSDPSEFAAGPWRDALLEASAARQCGVAPPLSSAMPSGRVRRAVSVLLANKDILRRDPPVIGRKVDLSSFPTLTPPLPASRVATLIGLFNRLQRRKPHSEVSLFEIDIWASADNDTISESLFLPLIMTLISSRHPDHFDVFEFVAWVDMLCVMSEREILRWVFFQMATLKPGALASLRGKASQSRASGADAAAIHDGDDADDDGDGHGVAGASGAWHGRRWHPAEDDEDEEDPLANMPPAIVLSQLPLHFKELARDHLHPTDPNLPILKELQRRARHDRRSVGPLRTQREALFARLLELGVADSLGVIVSSDLLFEEDFFAAMAATPQSFFPLQYLRTLVQNETFSQRFWTARRFAVLNWVDTHRTAVFKGLSLGHPTGHGGAIFPVNGGWGLSLHHPSLRFLLSPVEAAVSAKRSRVARKAETARAGAEESAGELATEKEVSSREAGHRFAPPALRGAQSHHPAALGVSPTRHLTIHLAPSEGAGPDIVVDADAGVGAGLGGGVDAASGPQGVPAGAAAGEPAAAVADSGGGEHRQLWRAHSESRVGDGIATPSGSTPKNRGPPDDGAGVGSGGRGVPGAQGVRRARRQSSPAMEKVHPESAAAAAAAGELSAVAGSAGSRVAGDRSFGRMATALDRRAAAARAQVAPDEPAVT